MEKAENHSVLFQEKMHAHKQRILFYEPLLQTEFFILLYFLYFYRLDLYNLYNYN